MKCWKRNFKFRKSLQVDISDELVTAEIWLFLGFGFSMLAEGGKEEGGESWEKFSRMDLLILKPSALDKHPRNSAIYQIPVESN